MDDLNNMSEDLATAQETNNKTEEMLESKILSLNLKKSTYIMLGDNKAVKELKEEANKTPLMISGRVMERVESIKYLGDLVSNSSEESIHQTVMKRISLA